MLHRHQKYEVFLTWIYGGWGGIFDDCACWCWLAIALVISWISLGSKIQDILEQKKEDLRVSFCEDDRVILYTNF